MTAPRATPTPTQKGCVYYGAGICLFLIVSMWAIIVSADMHNPAPVFLVLGGMLAGGWLERSRTG